MTTIDCISQKSFQGNHTHTFTIYGEDLDVVTQPEQVTLYTTAVLAGVSTGKKLSWDPVQQIVDSGTRHVTIEVYLRAQDQSTKPEGLVRRILNWLRALFGIKLPFDTTGDLTITITDTTGMTQLAQQEFDVTYTS